MDNDKVTLYFDAILNSLAVPKNEFARKAYWYVHEISKDSQKYISNVNTKFGLLVVNNVYLPLSVNETDYDNAYVCSPYTHYISYAYDELKFLPNFFLRKLCLLFLAPFSFLFKLSKINKIVSINNWLLSTCLYPNIFETDINKITNHVKKVYPGHAIQFRSLQKIQHKKIITDLQKNGYMLIPSRQVYLWKPEYMNTATKRQKKNFRQDKKILCSADMMLSKINPENEEEIKLALNLYNKLYIKKYSTCNPQLTSTFLQMVIEKNIIDVYLLKEKTNGYASVVGLLKSEDTITAPILGYNTDLKNAQIMYRACSALSYALAEKKNIYCHKSSGAAGFKRNRGCVPTVEYSCVYVAHLPLYRRLIWNILSLVLNLIAVPVIARYKL